MRTPGIKRTLVIGDMHGAHKALLQCLQRSGFDHEKDRLIVLGDVCDGNPGVKACIEELLKIKHCDLISGNHDLWALAWAKRGEKPEAWIGQGGNQTIEAYGGGPMPQPHVDFLSQARLWIELENKLFVHAGFDPGREIAQQEPDFLLWDRSLVEKAWVKAQQDPGFRFSSYEDIFVGHTPTQRFAARRGPGTLTPDKKAQQGPHPLFLCNVILLDTGAGWSGKLTIMDVSTHEYWQSDSVDGQRAGVFRI